MQVNHYRLQLYCIVLLTPFLAIPQAKAQLQVSDPVTQYVWDEAYASFTEPENTYLNQFIHQDYNAFWPDPTVALRALQALNPSSAYARSMLGIINPSDAEKKVVPKRKNRPQIAEYSLHWPVMLRHYYQRTGDEEYVRKMATEILPEVMGYFEDRMTRRGLLRSPSTWPTALQKGVDYPTMAQAEDAITNAFYYRALVACATLYQQLALDPSDWKTKSHRLKSAFHETFGQDRQRLFTDSPNSQNASVTANALAVCFGLTPPSAYADTVALIRKSGMNCAPPMIPYVIEACFIAGEAQLAIDLLSFMHDFKHNPAPLYLFPEHIFGLEPHTPGGETLVLTPRILPNIQHGTLRTPVMSGRISIDYDTATGMHITIPLRSRILINPPEGMNVVIKKYKSHSNEDTLNPTQLDILYQAQRVKWAGNAPFVWIDIDTQMLRVIQENTILYQARCASAAKGVGSQKNSLQTPLGWHSIHQKLGDDAPWGQIFRSRIATQDIWLPGQNTSEDLVLTRVLLLNGEEPGLNQGGQVDSLTRHIYIHGTNDEARIGIPSSHGCIRLTNDDVMDLYEILDAGTMVLITTSDQ